MTKLIEKVFISGRIVTETGLHIGGSKTALDIGGIDLNVIKSADGVPFIPGSSIKGKLRSLLAHLYGSSDVRDDRNFPVIVELFGDEQDREADGKPSRLIVRDATLDRNHFEEQKKTGVFSDLELQYTEGKWENTIDRKTGAAKKGGLRQLERVPSGSMFDFEIVYNVFDDNRKKVHLEEIVKAMRLLQDDYLGGHGSRGYGKIRFDNVSITVKSIDDYRGANKRRPEPSVTFDVQTP